MSNKCVKSALVRQRASPEGETKEQCLVCLSYLTILGRFLKILYLLWNVSNGTTTSWSLSYGHPPRGGFPHIIT